MNVYSLNGYKFKYEHNAWWANIFFHYSTNGEYFNNSDPNRSPLFCKNENTYSYLGDISNKYRVNNKFEFLLEYPEYPGYNRWTQTINPLYSRGVAISQMGFEAVGSLSWSATVGFTALHQITSYEATFLKCAEVESSWHYAIGAYHFYNVTNTIPGPYIAAYDGKYVKSVLLWIRLPIHPLRFFVIQSRALIVLNMRLVTQICIGFFCIK